MSNDPAHIAVFAFNRPQHLAHSLAALAGNDLAQQSNVTVFCDAPRSERDRAACDAVRGVAANASGFSSVRVVPRQENLGCARSVITGLAEIFAEHERVVVIEDDIVTSPITLKYLNHALGEYESQYTVFSVGTWVPPYQVVPAEYPYNSFFFPRFHCWGWASWRDRWAWNDWSVPHYAEYQRSRLLRRHHTLGGGDLPAMLDAQMHGKIDSWAIRAEYTRFLRGCVTVYPRRSLSRNIGMDGTGRHSAASSKYDVAIDESYDPDTWPFPHHVFLDAYTTAQYRKIYDPANVMLRLVGRVKRMLLGRSNAFTPSGSGQPVSHG
jgi:GT2 family glycosyltransferase